MDCRLWRLPTTPSMAAAISSIPCTHRQATAMPSCGTGVSRKTARWAIEVAGLHPATDSVVPYILGHIIPVPSETGMSYGDLDERYLTASYRVYLTEAQARNVFAYIKQKQASSPPVWQAGTVKCTGFISGVASYMGLRTPTLPTLMYPEDLVKTIKELNGGRQEMPSYASAH
jgi:hypothetical protein